MRTPSDRGGDRNRPSKGEAKTPPKKPYRSPRLVTYGNLSDLALAKAGLNNDGPGSPHSKF
jgi:hypothetical protein